MTTKIAALAGIHERESVKQVARHKSITRPLRQDGNRFHTRIADSESWLSVYAIYFSGKDVCRWRDFVSAKKKSSSDYSDYLLFCFFFLRHFEAESNEM